MALLSALAALRTPLVLVLVTGRTVTFGTDNALLSNVSAVLSTFRPGQMGGPAIANLLLGRSTPSGKLAQNWVRSAGQAGSGAAPWLQWRVGKWPPNFGLLNSSMWRGDPDGRYYDPYEEHRADPLFHFGFGL